MKPFLLPALALLAALHAGSALAGSPARSAADIERDAREHPQPLLDFAGITPGMHVVDLFGGGGYWAELLQARTGETGHVLLYNNTPYANYAAKDLAARFADGRLASIERRVAAPDAMQLGAARFDRAIMVMAFHDLYWVDEKEGWPEIDRAGFIDQVVAALKPGGALMIVDHAAADGSGMEQVNALHRIDEAFARAQLEARGLRFEADLVLLRNAEDDRTLGVFDPAIRGRTDRFVHLYRKPEAPTP